jgi:hypothetical protein
VRIISVAGATSKAGKTLLAEQMIRYCADRYRPVFAVKFSTTSDMPSPCPRGAPCTVCDLSDAFRIVRDPEILMQPGKNTQRFARAGATEVLWVIARKSQLPKAYEHLLTHLPENALAIFEGSTITEICSPDLLIYVLANHIPSARWKDSAARLLNRADVVLRNRKRGYADAKLELPDRALSIDLQETTASQIPEIRDKIEDLIRSLQHAVQKRAHEHHHQTGRHHGGRD